MFHIILGSIYHIAEYYIQLVMEHSTSNTNLLTITSHGDMTIPRQDTFEVEGISSDEQINCIRGCCVQPFSLEIKGLCYKGGLRLCLEPFVWL